MRLTVIALPLLTAALLVGCDQRSSGEAAPAADIVAEPAPGGGAGQRAAQAPAPAVAVPQLAYSYSFRFELPAKSVPSLIGGHERACLSAGPAVCQVVSASRSSDEGRTSANLSLRATPAWLAQLRGGFEGEARAAGGKLAVSTVESEDLTRAITDAQATLDARLTLRARLQQLLATRPGKLSELLELERELARVQGEIDGYTANLAVMRGRVAFSKADIAYGTQTGAGGSTWRPVGEALRNLPAAFAQSLAVLIYLIAWAVPLLAAAAVIWWVLRRLRGRRGPVVRRGKGEQPPAPPLDAVP